MAYITVFFNFTPDGVGGRYYMPKGSASVKNWYDANLKLYRKIVSDLDEAGGMYTNFNDPRTFKIYDNYIDLNIPATPGINRNAMNATYIAINDNDKETLVFYYVNSVKPLPQGYRLFISLDNWATYISIASITNVNFTRSNLQVGDVGEYLYITDEAPNFDGANRQYLPALNRSLNRKNIAVIAIIKHKTYQSFNTTTDEIHAYQFDVSDIAARDNIGTADNPIPRTEILAKDIYNLVDAVSSIYAVTDKTGGQGSAEVMHIYLLDGAGISAKRTARVAFKAVDNNGDKFDIEATQCLATMNEFNIVVMNTASGYEINPAAIGYKDDQYIKINSMGIPLYFGTKYNNIKLPPFVLSYSVKIRYEIADDKAQVTVIQGNEERDITKAFEVVAVANTATLTSLQATAKWLGVGAQIAGGAFQIAKGGVGYVSGTASIASAITGSITQNDGTVIGGGSGLLTFKEIIETNAGDIWYFVRSSITTNGTWQAMPKVMRNGAQCNIQYREPASNLLNYIGNLQMMYIANSAVAKTINKPFIACIATIDNIPYNAIEEITNRLAEGVQLELFDI